MCLRKRGRMLGRVFLCANQRLPPSARMSRCSVLDAARNSEPWYISTPTRVTARQPRLLLRARMGPFVHLAQPGGGDVRIDLRRRQALVAQQLLDAADIGAAIQEMGSEAVPQGVGRGAVVQAGGFEVLFQHAPDAARGQTAA